MFENIHKQNCINIFLQYPSVTGRMSGSNVAEGVSVRDLRPPGVSALPNVSFARVFPGRMCWFSSQHASPGGEKRATRQIDFETEITEANLKVRSTLSLVSFV